MNKSGTGSGWNRPKGLGESRAAAGARKFSWIRGAFAGLLVAALAGAAVWFLIGPGIEVAGGRARAIEAGPGAVVDQHATVEHSAASKSIADAPPMYRSPKQTRPRKDSAPAARGKSEKGGDAAAEEKVEKKKRRRVFTNPMDQLMAMVMPREAGDSVPPVPISEDMEFTPEQEQQMFEQLTVAEDDTDAIIERKEVVQAMREEYVQLKKKGWTFVDYIKALEAKAKLDNDVLVESHKINDTVFNDPEISDEKYYETLIKINKVLAERGIKPIKPPTMDESEDVSNQEENGK